MFIEIREGSNGPIINEISTLLADLELQCDRIVIIPRSNSYRLEGLVKGISKKIGIMKSRPAEPDIVEEVIGKLDTSR